MDLEFLCEIRTAEFLDPSHSPYLAHYYGDVKTARQMDIQRACSSKMSSQPIWALVDILLAQVI